MIKFQMHLLTWIPRFLRLSSRVNLQRGILSFSLGKAHIPEARTYSAQGHPSSRFSKESEERVNAGILSPLSKNEVVGILSKGKEGLRELEEQAANLGASVYLELAGVKEGGAFLFRELESIFLKLVDASLKRTTQDSTISSAHLKSVARIFCLAAKKAKAKPWAWSPTLSHKLVCYDRYLRGEFIKLTPLTRIRLFYSLSFLDIKVAGIDYIETLYALKSLENSKVSSSEIDDAIGMLFPALAYIVNFSPGIGKRLVREDKAEFADLLQSTSSMKRFSVETVGQVYLGCSSVFVSHRGLIRSLSLKSLRNLMNIENFVIESKYRENQLRSSVGGDAMHLQVLASLQAVKRKEGKKEGGQPVGEIDQEQLARCYIIDIVVKDPQESGPPPPPKPPKKG